MKYKTNVSEAAAMQSDWSDWGVRPSQVELKIKNALSALVLATSTLLLVARFMG